MAAGLLPLTGCRWLIQQSISEAKGAQGVVYPVTEPSSGALARLGSVRFEPATSGTNDRLTPPALLRAYDSAATEASTKDLGKSFSGGGSTLVIRTVLWYFQSKGVFSGAEAIGRAELSDGGSTVADLVIRAESEAFTAGGEHALASAMVKALSKYLQEKRGTKASQ
jgi:hypothetical protein